MSSALLLICHLKALVQIFLLALGVLLERVGTEGVEDNGFRVNYSSREL